MNWVGTNCRRPFQAIRYGQVTCHPINMFVVIFTVIDAQYLHIWVTECIPLPVVIMMIAWSSPHFASFNLFAINFVLFPLFHRNIHCVGTTLLTIDMPYTVWYGALDTKIKSAENSSKSSHRDIKVPHFKLIMPLPMPIFSKIVSASSFSRLSRCGKDSLCCVAQPAQKQDTCYTNLAGCWFLWSTWIILDIHKPWLTAFH